MMQRMLSRFTSSQFKKRQYSVLPLAAVTGAGLLGAALFGVEVQIEPETAECSDAALQPQHYEWVHSGNFNSFDASSVRRGLEVYRQVCATCHSLNLIYFRNLVGVAHTKEQVKAIAQSYEIKDGPNAEGEMFERPGRLPDHFPAPYPNEETGRFANGGAYPPDLSLMVKARARREDYVFALLTGYTEPPAGIKVREGLHYNPYFPGGSISMAKALNPGVMTYEDGTEATVSQMAKDVSTFLAWTAEPEHDERKKRYLKWAIGLAAMVAVTAYYKRFRWSSLKTRKVRYE